MAEISPEDLQGLLNRLDPDPSIAAERYELLRLKLVRCVVWKGCPEIYADALADTTLDRIAKKIGDGEVIENLNAYAGEVLKYVSLEQSRRMKERPAGDDIPEIAVEPDLSFLDEPDVRLNCLRRCMNEVVPENDDRALIIGYYDADAGKKNKDQRKELAERFGLTMNTLKVKACRLRARLETCINNCVLRAAGVTKPRRTDT